MTYLNIDPNRLEWLVRNGLSDVELRSFFKDCKPQLLLAGEKVQTLPRGPGDAARRVSHFSTKANAVFAAWLNRKRSSDSVALRDQLVPRFRAMENEGVEFSADELLELSRCGLEELYGNAPDKSWIEFMSSRMNSANNEEAEDGDDGHLGEASPETPSPSEMLTYTRWRLDKGSIDDMSRSSFKAIAQLDLAIRENDRSYFERFGNHSSEFNKLLDEHQILTSTISLKNTSKGVSASAPELISVDTYDDYLNLDVLAVPFKISDAGPTFFNVQGFIRDGKVFTLGAHDLKAVIPDEGRLILHQDLGHPSPKIGVYGAYRVQHFSTHLSIKVRIVGVGVPIHQVIYVPHTSTEHDAVREWVAAASADKQLAGPLFVTSDNLCVKPKGESLARVRTAAYDWVLECWDSLPGVEFGNSAYVVGPLPKAVRTYDCSPITTLARRVLREMADEKLVGLTKKQISEISRLIGTVEPGKDNARLNQLVKHLDGIARSDEHYEELVCELLRSPLTKADVEIRVQEASSQLSTDLDQGRLALENLRVEKQSAERNLEKLREAADKRVREIRIAVKKAFNSAKEKELETLGQLALFQGLLGTKTETPSPGKAENSDHARVVTTPALSIVSPLGTPVSDVFRAAGFPGPLCDAYAKAICAASALGMPIVVMGPGSSLVGMQIAQTLSANPITVIDISTGMVDIVTNRALSDDDSGSVFVRNANLSDMSIYAPLLLDRLARRFFGAQSNTIYPTIVLSGSLGPATLPWSSEVSCLAATIDLSASPNLGNLPAEPKSEAGVPFLRQKCIARVQLAAESESLTHDAQLVLLSFVSGDLAPPS